MAGWDACKGTARADEEELRWWRLFATRVENLPPVGSALLAHRLRIVDADGTPLPFGLLRVDHVELRSQDQKDRARLLGAGP